MKHRLNPFQAAPAAMKMRCRYRGQRRAQVTVG